MFIFEECDECTHSPTLTKGQWLLHETLTGNSRIHAQLGISPNIVFPQLPTSSVKEDEFTRIRKKDRHTHTQTDRLVQLVMPVTILLRGH